MTAYVSRADLLAYLSDHDDTELETIADCFGFKQILQKQDKTEPNVFVPHKQKSTVETKENVKKEIHKQDRPAECFYYLSNIKSSQLVPERVEGQPIELPDWIQDKDLIPLNLSDYKRCHLVPPKQKDLIPWGKIWPTLRKILSETTRIKRPDINHLVKIVANGEFPEKIPRQQHQNWAANATILIDFPDRLKLFSSDYKALLRSLKKMRGRTGLHIQQIKDKPGGKVSTGYGKNSDIKNWKTPSVGEPVLILSDAGLLESTSTDYENWLSFGRKLKIAGCIPYLLTPMPPRYLTPELISLFYCIHWDKRSKLEITNIVNSEESSKLAIKQDRKRIRKDLLPWLSAGLLIEPELLRSMCHLLSRDDHKNYHAGIESLCWTDADVDHTSTGFRFKHEKIDQYRDRLTELAKARPDLAQQVYELFKLHHGHKHPTEFYEEVLVIYYSSNIKRDETIEAAEKYYKQRIKHLFEQPKDNTSLLHHSYHFLQRQSAQAKNQQEHFSSLWAILKTQVTQDNTARPDWLTTEMVTPFLNKESNTSEWHLLLSGEALCLKSHKSLLLDNSNTKTSNKNHTKILKPLQTPLLTFSTSALLLVEERKDEHGIWQSFDHELQPQKDLSFPLLKGQRHLHVNGKAYTFSEITLPVWATSIGQNSKGLFVDYCLSKIPYRSYWQLPTVNKVGSWEGLPPGEISSDKTGLYVDIKLKNITQRFRYIEPGTFIMGSPEDEPDRETWSKETPHQVTLTQGFWMSDTTVTQALYEAVMGENPSRFTQDKNNPVEQVSWEEAHVFIKKINQFIPDLQTTLPSDAQWEYACRAGTTTPFSYGSNITPDQVNYHGHYPYHEGEKGLYREETIPVKSLPPNGWGLYEMHGNVWEWCEDVFREDLGVEPTEDPLEIGVGVERVLRGGSWSNFGGLVRSAIRDRRTPGRRFNSLGFRLLLGHVSSRYIKKDEEQSALQHGQALRDDATDHDGEQIAEIESKTVFEKAKSWMKGIKRT